MKNISYLYKLMFCLLILIGETGISWGQFPENWKGDKYQNTYKETSTTDIEIKHKKAKWFDWRNGISEEAKSMDTFSDDEAMFIMGSLENLEIQAAHTYIDTIYMHKGKSIDLKLPHVMDVGDNRKASVRSYQRWYNFRTQKTFATGNSSNIVDLLIPKNLDNVPVTSKGNWPYRLENGYVGNPFLSKNIGTNYHYPIGMFRAGFYFPTDEEFEKFTNENLNPDNNWYIVACDVSCYPDNTPLEKLGDEFTESTLVNRVLFYIHAVEDENTPYIKALKKQEQNQNGDDYWENYEITYPKLRVSSEVTAELIALTKDANAFAVPGDNGTGSLQIEIKDNTAGIKFLENSETTTLSGANRIVKFYYPADADFGMRKVNGESATIVITKTVNGITYRLARYKLYFKDDIHMLTQGQIKKIDEGNVTDRELVWGKRKDRTPKYLSEHYRLLTALNFDYDPNVGNLYLDKRYTSYYPFPLAWESSSYAFYDGSKGAFYDQADSKPYPAWSYYAITKGYMHWDNGAENIPGSNYHLYIDASDRPGTIAVLPFDEELCKGTELFISAWVKSADAGDNNTAAGNMLFTLMGGNMDKTTGKIVYTPIFSYNPGQIPYTGEGKCQVDGSFLGELTQQNQWFQIYFSFINNTEVTYEHYALKVSNNCASTSGGDMYLDDIRIYIAKPTAEVKQLKATCNQRTPMNIRINWDRLLSRTGEREILETNNDQFGQITYCFIDKWYYDKLRREGKNEEDAIKLAMIKTGDTSNGHDHEYLDMKYNLNFSSNTEYKKDGNCTGAQSNHHFYRYTDDSRQRFLTVDFSAEISPNRPYMMLISTENNPKLENFVFENDLCAINTSFVVSGQNVIRLNGEIINPTAAYCAGQMFDFKPQMRVQKEKQDDVVIEGIYYDWFFGTEPEYTKPMSGYDVSVKDALFCFREEYKDVEVIDESVTPKGDFTQGMLDLLKYLQSPVVDSNLHSRLVLHKSNLPVTLQSQGLALIIQPISLKNIPDYPDYSGLVCWDYIPVTLKAEGKSPELHAGFDYIKYPKETYQPALRIGLKQIHNADAERDDSERVSIKIPLREAVVSRDGYYLGRVASTLGLDKVFLIGSDDPALQELFKGEFNQYDYPIGTIEKLYAKEYNNQVGEVNFDYYANINFDLSKRTGEDSKLEQFVPREGFTYTLMLPFEEKIDKKSISTFTGGVGNSCYGQLVIPMKVVPEYLEWTGGALDNWHNDKNWKRADKNKLKKEGEGYLTNSENGGDKGFVPMNFSKVILQEGSKAELYWADFYGTNIWKAQRPSYLNMPTDSIQYDLVAHDGSLKTINVDGVDRNYQLAMTYKVNVCNQIHFEPNTELLHPELLYYKKAWIDYKLAKGKWHQLASPLKDVYAGDWYTDKNGLEKSELFQSISYTDDNSRFNPAVYQRGWRGDTQMKTTNSKTNNVVAVSGNWSAVYNDVTVPYLPGQGFSLKAVHDSNELVFRLPKSDTSYDYEQQTKSGMSLDRNSEGKLITNEFWQGSNTTPQPFTIEMQKQNGNSPYYLVGNPFTAHLDAETFFNENQHLEKKYWSVDGNGNQLIAVDSESGWTTTNGVAALIPPFTSFFVQKVNGSDANDKIKITDDMQRLMGGGEGPGKLATPAFTFVVRSTDGKESRASINYDIAAAAGYIAEEDAELFLDSNLSDIPAVYTAAGTMSASVNVTSDLWNIPVGVYSTVPGQVSLTVEGAEHLGAATLYDAELKKEIPLYNGCSVSLAANTHGRYFLRASVPTGVEVKPEHDILVYSVGEMLVITSTELLKIVRVIDYSGCVVCYKKNISDTNMCIHIGSGNYIVEVEDEKQKKTMKIYLK